MITKKALEDLYTKKGFSAAQIAKKFSCGTSTVNYYLQKYSIQKRSIADAIFTFKNPNGDPFVFKQPQTLKQWFLYGIGIGLYWGEGTKRSNHSVRLGNTDPELIKKFILFLEHIYSVKREKLRFGLQLFTDISEKEAKDFWIRHLKVSKSQFYKTTVTVSNKKGTYTNKVTYGVLTVFMNNKKLRDHLMSSLEKLRKT